MKKIFISFFIIVTTLFFVISFSSAFFSDKETSENNILQAGSLDLKIDNNSYLNGVKYEGTSWNLDDLSNKLFFNFSDIKPADFGEDTISLHADNDYWACMELKVTENSDNTCTEPELLDDPNCESPGLDKGELGSLVNFVWWADDGDNVLENDEIPFVNVSSASASLNQLVILADSTYNVWGGLDPIPGGKARYIGKAWCFGTLTLSPLPQGNYEGPDNPANASDQNLTTSEDGGFICDGTSLNNASQTDILKGNIEFIAVQSRHNLDFTCQPKICSERWADFVESKVQGKRKNGTNVLATRTDPSQGLVAQTFGNPYDNPVIEGTFYSLGFLTGGATGNYIVVGFNDPVFDFPGKDLKIFEVTGGSNYPDEKVKVEVSKDKVNWVVLQPNPGVRDQEYDINGLISWFKYVKITGQSDISMFEPTADDYDLDGVKAICND